MHLRRRGETHWVKTLALALVAVGLLAVVFGISSDARASSSVLVAQLGPGNQFSMGSRESGMYFEYTVTGAELGERQRDGAIAGTLTSNTVTVSGTLYMSEGEGFYTRPSMKAELGQQFSPVAEWKSVSWPPPEMRDADGYVGGPFEHEEAFSFTWQVKPELGVVIFNVNVSKVNGTSDLIGVGAWMYPPATTETSAEPPSTTESATTTSTTSVPAAGGRSPCSEPLFYYPGEDFSQWYTDKPSLNYDGQALAQQLVDGLKRYKDAGGTLTDGTQSMDVCNVPAAYVNGMIDTGKLAALQQAAREAAKDQQRTTPGYLMDPGTFFYLSLELNGGNVRDALATCHAATMRVSGAKEGSQSAANKKFVENEGVLQPLRNPEGYADKEVKYTNARGDIKPINPRKALGSDQQGVWYHLYGMAMLEYTDRSGLAGVTAAQDILMVTGYHADAFAKVQENGWVHSGKGGWLGDYAIALEEAKRSQGGSPPDVDKQCVNYWAMAAGAALKQRVSGAVDVNTPVGTLSSDTSWLRGYSGFGSMVAATPAPAVLIRSPLSLRIDGVNGEWFTYDQAAQRFDGNTALVVTDLLPEDDGTLGVMAAPMFEVASMDMEGTATGPVHLSLYDPATRNTSSYEFDVQAGDQVHVAWQGGDAVPVLNGSPLTPASVQRVAGSFPAAAVGGGIGGLVVVILLGVALLLVHRRRARARRALPPAVPTWPPAAPTWPAPAPVGYAAAPVSARKVYCRGCGAPLTPNSRFCNACGAAAPEHPAVCPQCGNQVTPGTRFCTMCGGAVG